MSSTYFSKNSKHGALAATVRTANQHVHPGLHFEGQFLDKYIPVRSHQWYLIEPYDVIARHNFAATGITDRIVLVIGDHRSFIFSGVQVVEDLLDLCDSSCESRQSRQFSAGQHQSADRLGQLHQHSAVRVVRFESMIGCAGEHRMILLEEGYAHRVEADNSSKI